MSFELLNPKGLEPPVGYAHVAKITSGTMVHVAGQAPYRFGGLLGQQEAFGVRLHASIWKIFSSNYARGSEASL